MKRALPIAAAVLILLGIGLQFAPDFIGGRAGKLDLVIAVYESENEAPAEASVLGGQTANAIRKAGKWRQFDKDKIPAEWSAVVATSVAKINPHFEPGGKIPFAACLVAVRSKKVVASAAVPKTDADLAAFVEKQGGF